MGLFSSFFGWLGSQSNADAIRHTNLTNLQIARETNKANVEQANLAYMRSLPVQQVSQLRAAGMSKAAAINALSGGGVYSPPAAVGATMQAPTQDYSFLRGLDESLMGIPSNVQQFKIAAESLNGLKIDNENKQKAEQRAQELHEFNVWKEQYGKDSATKLDAAKQLIMNALLDQNKDVSNYKTFSSLIQDLGLSDAKELRSLPSLAWSQIESSIRDGFADARAERDQSNRDTSAKDAHDLAEFNKTLSKLDISERKQSLVYKLGILANQLALSNFQVDDANKNAIIRQAGFENEKEANEAMQAAENLRARESKRRAANQANYDDNFKGFMEFLDYTLDKVNPLKNLFSK